MAVLFWFRLFVVTMLVIIISLAGMVVSRAQDITVTKPQDGPRIMMWCRPGEPFMECRPWWRYETAEQCRRIVVLLNNERDARIDRGHPPGDIATCRAEK